MPLSQEELARLKGAFATNLSVPLSATEDRVGVARATMIQCLNMIAPLVSLDKPAPQETGAKEKPAAKKTAKTQSPAGGPSEEKKC